MTKKLHEKYKGKAKTLYTTDDPTKFYCEFRNDTSAFNGQKVEQLERKGMVNNYFNAFIMQYLQNNQVATHFVELVDDNASLVEKLDMFPLECVVRNYAAGSLCKRLGLEKGQALTPPVFEFFYKSDKLGDPLINDSHIETFSWASKEEVETMKALTLQVNAVLSKLFLEHEMILVDYKLEFGKTNGQIVLADEFTPDGCRIWDANTLEVLDKDRFRQDLGNVVESYELVAKRLNIEIPQ